MDGGRLIRMPKNTACIYWIWENCEVRRKQRWLSAFLRHRPSTPHFNPDQRLRHIKLKSRLNYPSFPFIQLLSKCHHCSCEFFAEDDGFPYEKHAVSTRLTTIANRPYPPVTPKLRHLHPSIWLGWNINLYPAYEMRHSSPRASGHGYTAIGHPRNSSLKDPLLSAFLWTS